MEKKQYSFWFYIVLVTIPFFVIFLLEISLRIFDYGNNYETFVVLEEISDQYFFNPELPQKYFTGTTAVPSVIPEPFDKVKNNNTIRVFIFGGSTTAGYPYSANAAFPRQIKRKLEMFYPDYKVEVINLGVSAVNTHFIRDILPDVLEHDPDLLVFYTGHNEYYGALGPASTEYIFTNPTLVQFLLDLREFKIYQLIQNITEGAVGIFQNNDDASRSTLMSEMIKEQEVPTGSEIYDAGLNQFKENFNSILEMTSSAEVPVVVGDLVSNLKQSPLLPNDGVAQSYFEQAEEQLAAGDISKSKEKFIKAKDYDLLKFRATEDFNAVINELQNKFEFSFISTKNAFEKNTPDGITGFNLMVDHLHPNLDGYKLMADQFYNAVDLVLSNKFRKQDELSTEAINNYLEDNFPFGRYDSTLSKITIELLLNDFPFKKNSTFSLAGFPLKNYEDSLAMQSITKGLGWAAAQRKIFDYYFVKGNYAKAADALFILMEDRPFYKAALEDGIPKLISKGMTREAKHILVRNHNRYPDFFTSKNLGIINMNEGNALLANKLLLEANTFSANDPEIHFYLSRSYFALKDIDKAISEMITCLNISPDYPGAKKIYDRLLKIKSQNQN